MNYPGDGEVALRIQTEGRTVIGELPSLSVSYCPELHEELEAMVGAGSRGGGGKQRRRVTVVEAGPVGRAGQGNPTRLALPRTECYNSPVVWRMTLGLGQRGRT